VVALLVAVAMLPWENGSLSWTSQARWLPMGWGILVGGLLIAATSKSERRRVPTLSLCLLALAAFAWLQSTPIPGWHSGPMADLWSPGVAWKHWAMGLQPLPGTAWFHPDVQRLLESVPQPENHQGPSGHSFPSLTDATREPPGVAWSLSPELTGAAMGLLVLCSLGIWIGFQAFRLNWHRLALLTVISALGGVVACMDLADRVAWRPDVPGVAKVASVGPFLNKNQGAAFLLLALCANLGLLIDALRRRQRFPPLISPSDDFWDRWNDFWANQLLALRGLRPIHLALGVHALLLITGLANTLSRGGLIAGILATFYAIYCANPRRGFASALFWAGCMLVAGGLFLGLFGLNDPVLQRFQEIGTQGTDTEANRPLIWRVSLQAWLYFFATGSGLGTFRYACLPFLPMHLPGWTWYAESLLLQMLVEFGCFGLIILLVAGVKIFNLARWTHSELRDKRSVAAGIATLTALLAIGFHNAIDFRLISPAVSFPMALLLGSHLRGLAEPKTASHSRGSSRQASLAAKREDAIDKYQRWTLPIGLGAIGLWAILLNACQPVLQRQAKQEQFEQAWNALQSPTALRPGMPPDDPSQDGIEAAQWASLDWPRAEIDVWRWRRRVAAECPSSIDRDAFRTVTHPLAIASFRLHQAADPSQPIAWPAEFGGPTGKALIARSHASFLKAIAKDPMDGRSHRGAFRTLWDQPGAIGEQNQRLIRCALLNKNRANDLVEIAMYSQRLGQNDLANLCSKFALRQEPRQALVIASQIAETASDPAAIDLFPPDDAVYDTLLSSPLADPQRFPKTRHNIAARWKELIDSHPPNNLNRWQRLAQWANRLKDPPIEQQAYQELIRLAPTEPTHYIGLARSLQAQGKIQPAIDAIVAAIKSCGASRQLADLYQQLREARDRQLSPK
jgi:tetratricopeptide (TPR) repeat protein